MADQEERGQQPFPEDALTEVIRIQERMATALLERSEVKGITINGPLTKTCDLAFWLERTDVGGYTIFVSMIDVASFIDSSMTPALDREAQTRAFAHHTLEKVFVPLLPDSLAEGSLSLLGQSCPTLTLALSLDSSYHVGEPSLQQSVVRSRKRFTYEEADQEMADTQAECSLLFQDAYHVALRLWHARMLQGALSSYDLENGWVFTEDGVRILLDADKRYKAYIIEQEFLILANQTLASYLAAAQFPALYRKHALTTPPTKATYGPGISGHEGLNVPVYIHALFPLRSYPDLVNQRILLACLRGEPSPYTLEELEALAPPLNAKEALIKAEKRGYFLSEHDGALKNHVGEEGHLPDLDQKQFHSLIRRDAEEQTLTPELAQEILRRLEEYLLKDNDLYTLVFRFSNSTDEWYPIKQAVCHFLQKNPPSAAAILNQGQQQGKWKGIRYEHPPAIGYFQANVSLEYEGQIYTSSVHTALRKDRAKQLAGVEILSMIAGVVLLSSPEISTTELQEFVSDAEEGI